MSTMKRFRVKKAFAILDKVLLLPEDEIYAEQAISFFRIFNPKTRKFMGAVNEARFLEHTVLWREPRVTKNKTKKLLAS